MEDLIGVGFVNESDPVEGRMALDDTRDWDFGSRAFVERLA